MTDANPTPPVALKACPFCGGSSVVPHRPPLGRVWNVHCDDCEFPGPSAPSKEDAIAAWNQRTDPDAAGMREAGRMAERGSDNVFHELNRDPNWNPTRSDFAQIGHLLRNIAGTAGQSRLATPAAPRASEDYARQFDAETAAGLSLPRASDAGEGTQFAEKAKNPTSGAAAVPVGTVDPDWAGDWQGDTPSARANPTAADDGRAREVLATVLERANYNGRAEWVREQGEGDVPISQALAAMHEFATSPRAGELRLREALEPFAKLGGPINGEAGRITYVEAIGGNDAGEELQLSTYVGNGQRVEVLHASDFLRAHAALRSDVEGGSNG